ncbi:MAG: biotin synthase BioB [Desulfobulbaceae bacterium]|jgi:biotin synthase|nr:biotin synthase BioB [Desulfobulbaceae bacterium]
MAVENPFEQTSTLDLMAQALRLKLARRQDRFSLCSILNAKSGKCSEDCAYCTQSAHFLTNSPEYPLVDVKTAVAAAVAAKDNGASRFSLVTSGRGPVGDEVAAYGELIGAIKGRVDIGICGSFGIASLADLTLWRDAGMSRYHHNLESSQEFFPSICATHTFAERVATVKAAREAGLSVCSGGIIGLGEDETNRVSLARSLAELEVDSVPLNILISLEGTALSDVAPLSQDEILRAIAIFRIILPDVPLRLAAGRESALGEFLSSAFMAGADGMMIGGYLTQRGRTPEQDLAFVNQMREIWTR